ncbi:MAG: nitroreductase family protein [Bacteroidia bacterium]|nr:nitroreductase family protein [Bacteroidia bacterium]
MENNDFIKYEPVRFSEKESEQRAHSFRTFMDKRRSIRYFSDKPVSKQLIEDLIMTGSSAPSGAHKQPWTFCAVSNAELKSKIRAAAENEEYESYNHRMSDEWLEALKPFGTDWHKEFLDIAPWLIIVFKKSYDLNPDGSRSKNYYVNESVGLAVGFLLAAIHNAGLVSLTHTPSPMNFLQTILERPPNEKPFLLMPVGYPADEVEVPNLNRKSSKAVIQYYE